MAVVVVSCIVHCEIIIKIVTITNKYIYFCIRQWIYRNAFKHQEKHPVSKMKLILGLRACAQNIMWLRVLMWLFGCWTHVRICVNSANACAVCVCCTRDDGALAAQYQASVRERCTATEPGVKPGASAKRRRCFSAISYAVVDAINNFLNGSASVYPRVPPPR